MLAITPVTRTRIFEPEAAYVMAVPEMPASTLLIPWTAPPVLAVPATFFTRQEIMYAADSFAKTPAVTKVAALVLIRQALLLVRGTVRTVVTVASVVDTDHP